MHILDNSGVFKRLWLNLFLLKRAGTWHIISANILPNISCWLSTKITAILCCNCGQGQLLVLCEMWKGSGDRSYFFMWFSNFLKEHEWPIFTWHKSMHAQANMTCQCAQNARSLHMHMDWWHTSHAVTHYHVYIIQIDLNMVSLSSSCS